MVDCMFNINYWNTCFCPVMWFDVIIDTMSLTGHGKKVKAICILFVRYMLNVNALHLDTYLLYSDWMLDKLNLRWNVVHPETYFLYNGKIIGYVKSFVKVLICSTNVNWTSFSHVLTFLHICNTNFLNASFRLYWYHSSH